MKWFYNLKLKVKMIIGYLLVGFATLFSSILIPNDLTTITTKHLTFLFPLILCIVVAVSLGLIVSYSITKPINKLISCSERIALGDVNIEIGNDSNDEVGLLMTSFKKTIQNIKENTNIVQALADGDLSIKIEVKSERDIFSKNIISLRDSLKLIENDANLLYLGATKGKLLTLVAEKGPISEQKSSEKFSGCFKNIVIKIDGAIDAIIIPLNEAVGYVDRISKGDIPEKITDSYNGDYNTIKNNLNNCIDNINAMVRDTNMIAQAAAQGKLEIRADESKHSGDFKNIIAGFNRTLNSITEPINEARQVINKISVNDFTTEMTGTYKGDMKEFSEEINQVHERLIKIQNVFGSMAKGDTSILDHIAGVGKCSENDNITASILATLTAIKELTRETGLLSVAGINGDFNVRCDASKFEGGYREIVSGFNKTLDAIEKPIDEASEILEKMAAGDLTESMEGDYKGSYSIIKDSINNTINSFNEILGNINNSADQVSTGSKQVSYGSQALSQGATEQASSIEELTASITQVAAHTKQNALNANQSNEFAGAANKSAEQGNSQMKEMLNSMEEINESSSKISKIIKVIDDIAFQTNILALNAAVEAARAGQHGKGFAVVAEEVRNLAARSAKAAKETQELIESSIKKAESGTKIASDTANYLNEIVSGGAKAGALIAKIASASNEQATAISQINKGIEQVAQVIQTNSATAEESAAASEELSSQAELLKNMIGNFKLKAVNNTNNVYENKKISEVLLNAKTIVSSLTGEKIKSSKPRISLSNNEFGKY